MRSSTRIKESTEMDIGYHFERDVNRYLTFFLTPRVFAINLMAVKEIIEYSEITSIPKLPAFIRGAINLRGKVIPVVDLSVRLDYEETVITKRSCIIVVELVVNDEPLNVGILVDLVNQVTDLTFEQLEDAPSFGGNIKTEYIEAMAKIDNKFVVVLNIQSLLSMDDIASLEDVSLREEII